MRELVSKPRLQEVDGLAHHAASHLGPNDLAVHVDGDLGQCGPVPGRIRRFRQLHAGKQDGFVDVVDDAPICRRAYARASAATSPRVTTTREPVPP